MKRIFQLLFILAFISVFSNHSAAETKKETIKINGSSTVTNFAFKPQDIANLRAEGKFDFSVIISSSGRGLIALSEDKADIAMISSDIETVIQKLKQNSNVELNLEDYEVHKLQEAKILFITNKKNPLKNITKKQAKELFEGTITSWKDLGIQEWLGNLKIVTEHPTGGMYSLVDKKLTTDKGITDKAINMQNAPQVMIVVSQVPGSFGFISNATPKNQMNGISVLKNEDFEIVQEMYFVTKKDEKREAIYSLIDHIKTTRNPSKPSAPKE